ncbi:MAG: hypothetical protein LBU53_11090 [Zoogloeaceae bacterium]|jgi:hypothetical protein|nr:hypothetical protein [Zoogloeaceae bacterium]
MKKLRPIQPSAALRVWYQKQLLAMIHDMDKSYRWWLTARYRARESEIAQDASPTREITAELAALGAYWTKKFTEFAQRIAKRLADRVFRGVNLQLINSAKAGGFLIRPRNSRRSHDVLQAIRNQKDEDERYGQMKLKTG